MFESKIRDLIIPQYEHGRLAGVLAQVWGNDAFDRPVLPFPAFVDGIAFHDWHYGLRDTLSISGASEADWLVMARRGLDLRLDNPVADILAKLHLRRLYGFNPTPERRAAMAEIDRYLDDHIPATGYTRAQFDWADRITRFCDYAAFFFSFEEPCERRFGVSPRRDSDHEVELTVRVLADGRMTVTPWPFSVARLDGILVGYGAAGYPDQAEPVVVPYQIISGDPANE